MSQDNQEANALIALLIGEGAQWCWSAAASCILEDESVRQGL